MPANNNNVLHYFELRGRAELLRLILQYSNEPYQEKFIKLGDHEQLSKFPVGQLPVWQEIDQNGNITFLVHQSQTIARYLARKHGLLPVDDLKKAALIESVQDTWSDVRDITIEYAFVGSDENRQVVKKKLFDKLKRHRKFHSDLIGDKSQYFKNGEKVTLADFALFDVFDQVVRVDKTKAYEVGGEAIVRVYENVASLLQRYHQSPQYLSKAVI